MITLESLHFLASSEGERLLARLAGEDLSDANTLRLLTALRKDYAPDEAGAALELARLREKAVEKFGDDARRMFFTRSALEQASDPLVRDYRSGAVQPSEPSETQVDDGLDIVDVCASIGSDSLAFARTGACVLGIDLDPVRVEMARLNAAALSLAHARFEVRDARDPLPPARLIFFDPARRDAAGNRIYDVERYQPPLSLIRGWQPPVIVKLSPGVDLAQLEAYGGWVEFLSVEGDLKEALLHRGQADGGMPPRFSTQATLLLLDGSALHWAASDEPAPSVVSAPRGWLVEPDAALLRAGLVADAAVRWNGAQLDETIAYITTDDAPETPWARSWQIVDWMPFSVKRLRSYLREQRVGSVTVKKRGTAVTPETLIPQLKLKGDERRTLVLTRCRGEQIVMVCR